MRLSPRDFDLLQRAVLALYELRSVSDLERALPGILFEAIRADSFFQMEYELGKNAAGARLLRRNDPGRRITPRMVEFFEQAYFEHPFPQHIARTGDLTPLKMSDFYNRRQYRNSEIYRNFYKAVEAEGLISTVLLGPGPHDAGCISLCRRKDFSERDRDFLKLLRPHLIQARLNAERWTAWTQGRAAAETATLTPREAQVARWLAEGKTNFEIATILESKPRTVEKHVERILEKLGVENRTAAAVMLSGRNPSQHVPANVAAHRPLRK